MMVQAVAESDLLEELQRTQVALAAGKAAAIEERP